MIINSKVKEAGLQKIEYDGDNFIMTHAEEVGETIRTAGLIRTHSDNGWTEDRNFRQIGRIPSSVILKHPEFMKEPKLLKRWLMSEEGAPYRTVNAFRTR